MTKDMGEFPSKEQLNQRALSWNTDDCRRTQWKSIKSGLSRRRQTVDDHSVSHNTRRKDIKSNYQNEQSEVILHTAHIETLE